MRHMKFETRNSDLMSFMFFLSKNASQTRWESPAKAGFARTT
jgi:hypothetical protein